MSTQTRFPVGNDFCQAWLTLPEGPGPHPAVVLAHGGGATHEMKLAQYESWFSQAGLAVLAFDYRHFGESGGQPRQLMNARNHLQDIEAAIAFVRSRPQVDSSRVALWGTSLGCSHVVTVAARHPELAAVVIQCPVLSFRQMAFRMGLRKLASLTLPILEDLARAALGRPRRYVRIVGRPGETAFVTLPGAYEAWNSVVPAGYAFDNRVTAASAFEMLFYEAGPRVRKIRSPLLVCVCDREELTAPWLAARAAAEAQNGTAIHYDAGHFDVYNPPWVGRIVADQTRFLVRHLRPPATSC